MRKYDLILLELNSLKVKGFGVKYLALVSATCRHYVNFHSLVFVLEFFSIWKTPTFFNGGNEFSAELSVLSSFLLKFENISADYIKILSSWD